VKSRSPSPFASDFYRSPDNFLQPLKSPDAAGLDGPELAAPLSQTRLSFKKHWRHLSSSTTTCSALEALHNALSNTTTTSTTTTTAAITTTTRGPVKVQDYISYELVYIGLVTERSGPLTCNYAGHRRSLVDFSNNSASRSLPIIGKIPQNYFRFLLFLRSVVARKCHCQCWRLTHCRLCCIFPWNRSNKQSTNEIVN